MSRTSVNNIIWGVIIVALLLIGIAVKLFLPVAIIVGLLLVWWRWKRTKRDIKERENSVPQYLLNEFEEAERRWEEDGGQTEPHEILWDIAKRKQRTLGRPTVYQANPTVTTGQFLPTNVRRQDIQGNFNPAVARDTGTSSGNKRSNRKSLFARRR